MTAFGSARQTNDIGSCTVEIQSVNRRFLELSVSLPKELSSFERLVKKELEKSASRGALSCNIQMVLEDAVALEVTVRTPLANSLAASWKKLFEELGLKGSEETLPALLLQQESRLFVWEKNEKVLSSLEALLLQTVSCAAKEFCAMKEQEGKALAQDLLARIEKIEEIAKFIESTKDALREEMKAKLFSKVLQEWQEGVSVQDLIVKEVCQIVEKSDVTEELVRIFSHVEQFKDSLKSCGSIGKKLEFISQELLREANTIGSKVIDLATTRLVIDAKTEIERIRQQIQNVE